MLDYIIPGIFLALLIAGIVWINVRKRGPDTRTEAEKQDADDYWWGIK